MSKTYTTINIRKKQSTTWITLNRPNKLNAINATMLQELSEALDTIEKDTNVRCVIITGEGEKAFSAGADITELQKLTQETAAELSRKGQQVFSQVEKLPKPVVAAINGYALGGGLALALACDFRLASIDAELGSPEIKLGIIPAWGGTQRLAKIVGVAEAKRLVMLGDRVKAEEALKMGLVDKVVPPNRLEAEAEALAQRLCEYPPAALKSAKHAIDSGTHASFEYGLNKETEVFAQLFSTKETKERIEAFWSRETKKRETVKSE
jgi:enoyl-CoA hydratase/3-hydroxyacyl-CoA dehydrogenase